MLASFDPMTTLAPGRALQRDATPDTLQAMPPRDEHGADGPPHGAPFDVPCPAASLPTELVAMVAKQLAPADFFAMTGVCRSWHAFRTDPGVVRGVASQRVLGPPPLHDAGRHYALASGNEADDVRLEGSLMLRLRRGPLCLGPNVTYQAYKFSPTYRYILRRDRYAHQTTLHRLCGSGLVDRPLQCWSDKMAVCFAPVGDALFVWHPEQGPLMQFMLEKSRLIGRTVVPQSPFTFAPPVCADGGKYLLFTCSDGLVRAAREQSGQWMVTVQKNLSGRGGAIMALSQDTKTVLMSDDGGRSIAMHYRDRKDAWWQFGATNSVCCGEFDISPKGRFVTISGCGASDLMLDPHAPEEPCRVVELSRKTQGVSVDENLFFRVSNGVTQVFRWPNAKHVGTLGDPSDENGAWVSPYLRWSETHRELEVVRSEPHPETGDPGAVTLQLQAEIRATLHPNPFEDR